MRHLAIQTMPIAFHGVIVAQAPAAPTPPPGRVIQLPELPAPIRITDNSPSALYEAMRNQRRELLNQLERLNDQREDISDELRESHTNGVNPGGLEARLKATDERIAGVETQLAQADAAVASAAAIPGAIVPPAPRPPRPGPPEEFYVLAGLFMFIVVLPLTIAYARRIWRRGAMAVSQIPAELYERFSRLEHAVDSVAIEVERIGEGQRYMTKLYAERGLGAGPGQPVESSLRAGDRQGR